MKVLIGYDGSRHSDTALDDLRLAGLPREMKSLIVSVADPLMASRPLREVVALAMPSRRVVSGDFAQSQGDRAILAEEFSMKAVNRLLLEFPDWEVANQTRIGTAAWELIDAADEWNADLVVVGSESVPVVERILLGSVSKRVATESRRSVRVARSVERKKPYAPPKITIGVDGSPAAQEAVYEVGRRVWPDGTQVKLVVARSGQPMPGYDQRPGNQAESMLEWARYHLKATGLNVSMSIQTGDPKRILLGEARKWRSDCLFVGCRNFKSGFERYKLGSVSTAVVTKAPCSVEIVRPVE
ncbi:MAG: universal stress protein [Chloracidobacterium sp.]|nr:universal stress protein [Chloracidobacterium sp.]